MLSHKDIKVLRELRQNARSRLTEISKRTNIPVSTIHDKLKSRYDGIIMKMTCLVDFRQMGYTARAFVTLKVDKKDRDALRGYLEGNPNVNNIFKINNGYDFMVEGVFRFLQDFEDFSEELDEKFSIKEKQMYYVIEDVKREACYSGD